MLRIHLPSVKLHESMFHVCIAHWAVSAVAARCSHRLHPFLKRLDASSADNMETRCHETKDVVLSFCFDIGALVRTELPAAFYAGVVELGSIMERMEPKEGKESRKIIQSVLNWRTGNGPPSVRLQSTNGFELESAALANHMGLVQYNSEPSDLF
ncbi:hypothetical protein HG531_006311 [Fusarium graminearum]|nr:hypothetical protein HG531_006311 [Fusarium graminearum]